MGQKVNSKIFKYGVSNFWENTNYILDQKKKNLVAYNYLYKVISFFLYKYKMEVFFFKILVQEYIGIYVFLYNNLQTTKRFKMNKKFIFKKSFRKYIIFKGYPKMLKSHVKKSKFK
jgi:hypothetical protein